MPMSIHLVSILLLLLPFAGALAVLGAGRRGAGPVAIALTALGLGLSGWLALTRPAEPQSFGFSWATFVDHGLRLGLRIDSLAVLMLLVVHFVALLVQVYSLSYLHDEPAQTRYFASLQLFVGAMLGIVLAGNLLVMYVFWELVGLASYLLIGFYADRPSAGQAAQKAFLMNRVGDIGFLLGIFMTYLHTGSLELGVPVGPLPTLAGLCLFMGCVGKSAQFPLLTWLPDAMEGPTPVSALLHAATMVAAGIFLLARIHPLLSADALVVITVVGTITTCWGGYSALFQTDIKKVLAFSTVSQLGLMVAAMGTGNVGGAMFHLLTHAFFKAGLFLGAGAVIHAVHTQDMRQMGGLRRALPVTFAVYTLCTAALIGLPFFSGFLSKEVILGGAFAWAAGQGGLAALIPVLLLLSSGLTALYMARQWRLVFWGDYRHPSLPATALHEADWLMRLPMLLLAGLSLFFWFSINPLSAHHSWFWRLLPLGTETAPVWLGPASVALVLGGAWLGFRLRDPKPRSSYVRLSVEYGFLDTLYQALFINPLLRLADLLNHTDQRVVDRAVNGVGVSTVVLAHLASVVDRFGVDGLVNSVAWLAGRLGRLTRSVQNGRVQSYITAAVVGLLLVLWWVL